MGLKENFNQAMRELLNKGGIVGSESEDKDKVKDKTGTLAELDAYLDDMTSPSGDASSYLRSSSGKPDSVFENAPFDQDTAQIATSVPDTGWKSASFEDRSSPARPGNTYSNYNNTNYAPSSQESDYNRMFRQAEEMTIISKNTMIVGDIKTLANITVEGNIRGQVDALKDANIRGSLIGNLNCNNSEIRGSSIQGNVTTKGSTYIDSDSILLGDIKAQFASIDGKVKGNIDIGSKIELRRNAIVAGNIDTNTISIEDGANIRGFINTTFLKEKGDGAFPKQVVINSDQDE